MKSLSIAILLTLALAGPSLGQTLNETFAKVRQIKLLQSTRDDVKRILHGYEATDDKDHFQEFSKGDLTIEVTYSSGTCTEDSDEEDASEIWSVKEWTVTRVEISPSEQITLRDAGLNLSNFKKEPRYPETTDSFVFHNKSAGFAVKTYDNEVKQLIFFPPRASSNKLCRNTTSAKGFYTRKGWFSLADPYDYPGCINYPADVTELNLSAV
jgi:hypothetical protein